MAAPVSLCHAACCANRAGAGAVSWGRRGVLAFGTSRDVLLYEPKQYPLPLILKTSCYLNLYLKQLVLYYSPSLAY
uniref:Uncharacterized protein n=1 Tax=Nothoprocta perdicaria TaxID=30464 RepID=A0A8C7EGA8_NOTPE